MVDTLQKTRNNEEIALDIYFLCASDSDARAAPGAHPCTPSPASRPPRVRTRSTSLPPEGDTAPHIS